MNMDSMDCDNKYQHGKIYKLTSSETTDIYIGSTIQPLCKRLKQHKHTYKRYLKGKYNYVYSYELSKYVDCKIELIKEYPCDNKHELDNEEGIYQKKMKCVNRYIAGRNKKEYYEDNKEKIKVNKSQKCICECGKEYTYSHKSRHEKSTKHQDYIKENNN
jgi:hypothetical protein